jgi:hypothetical protein
MSDYKAGKNPVTGKTLEITPPRTFTPSAEKWFKAWPTDLPKRFSLKFRHQGDGHSGEKCITCHVNVAQMTTLNIPKADVPITSCAQCHGKDEPVPVSQGTSVTILDEMTLKVDTAKNYTCVACHTSLIGRERPPCSHYSAINQPCPTAGQPAKGEGRAGY